LDSQKGLSELYSTLDDELSRIMDTSPTGHFTYWTVRLLDILPTAWKVRLQIAHFAYNNAGIKSDL